MRRFFSLLLAALLLCPAAGAAETNEKYIALAFACEPSVTIPRSLLEGLETRGAKATFFLCGSTLEQNPSLARELLDAGHEIGLQSYSSRSLQPLSRRQIAKELSDSRALLPSDCKVTFLHPPGGICSDGIRQVAEVTGLSILGKPSREDVVLLPCKVGSLAAMDRMTWEGFQFITLSELAELRKVRLKPGIIYNSFLSG